MISRKSLVPALGAMFGLALTVASVSALSTFSNREYLTFTGPVALPGVTLGAGTYTFEIANPETGADVIVVRNRQTWQVCFLGITHSAVRPAGLPEDRSVTFGESARGVAPPILAWYPSGESTGRAFIYR